MSFTGQGKSWGYAVSISRRNMAERNSAWLSNIEELSKIHNRLKNVIIENKDFREVIRDYDSEETLFYLDPPYILDTRRTGKIYTYEMTDEDYEDLIKILLGVKGNVILSNYKDPRFIELEKNGWQRKDIKKAFSCVNARNTKTKGYRIESIWLKIGGVK
jgi:DNA adenine methylase